MLPLHDGTVLISDYKETRFGGPKCRVVRLSNVGTIMKTGFTTDEIITGFIYLSEREFLILHMNGSLKHVGTQEWKVQEGHQVPDVEYLCDGIRMDDDQVLLVDAQKGEIFLYDLKAKIKHVVIDELNFPSSVDKAVTDQGVFYIVNEQLAHTVHVYNDRWMLVRSIGGHGWEDGCFNTPDTSRVMPDNTVIVSDKFNHRISRFTLQGDFIQHLLQESDGIRNPDRLAVQFPYVWLSYDSPYSYSSFKIKCYKI